ncbi:MAG: hypothetical protein H7227_01920 [Actinobacteria bacterium]|nr:hypothetical protein [Actinomycetota bacterium]
MTALGWVNNISLIVHILSVVGILVLLLTQATKKSRVIPVGTLHAALTALVAGGLMVGIRNSLHGQDAVKWEEFDQAKVGVKFLILGVIIYLIVKYQKRAEVKTAVWLSLIGLTIANILIAVLW